ncbi:Bug family tripartite tricarboxylate transporter substrate binding protein [Halegenticoccus tardaugens]|uniref:Bug family tripartite tricarboxylate transporter substrate binding protein n=1 Tax=Halegenticoccus tardaugens TaxID=2071624 RepID=UPI00100A98AD|nr:tripartite tricarboxylate transporter substrate-binding protein [Halegenticoccus tardaugens]
MAEKATQERLGRRTFLKYSSAASVVGITGLAGCTEGGGGGGGGGSGGNDYPSDDLTYIVPFSEGGGTDTYARQIIPEMGNELGVNIAIENISGAASLRGTGQLFTSKPDGSTFGGFNPPSTPVSAMVNPTDFDLRDLVGVGAYARTPFVVVANPEHEIDSMDDTISRYQSGELTTFAGKERGGVDHVLALSMKNNSDYGLAWENYVGYDGSGPAVQAVVSGEVPVSISTDTAAAAAAEDDRIDVVTCLSSEGTSVFPDLEPVTEQGFPNIDYLGQLRRCMYVPPETPNNVVQTLTGALETALETDRVQNWSENSGNVIEYGPPEAAEKAVAEAFKQVPKNVNLDSVRQDAS